MGRIQNAAHTLLGQINSVLDLSKVEAGQLDAVLAEHELAAVVSDSVELVRPLADAQGLELRVEGSVEGTVHTDRGKLSQVLTNLLTNAVKFTAAGLVVLEIQRWERSGLPWMRLEVVDTGVGIGPDLLDRVFEPFAQAEDSGVATLPGTGLGLSICRAFVEMLGGQIYVESSLGEGSRFVVEVPAGRMESLTVTRTPSTPLPDLSNTAHQRVLVIDDDVRFLELMERTLGAPGRQIIATDEPRRALSWAKRYRADVILLDVQMPDLDGWSFLVRLRDTACADSPVLVVSGDADDQVALALGAVGMVKKPVSSAELREQITAVLAASDSGTGRQT